MHPSSYHNMKVARAKIQHDLGTDLTILDLGGRDIKVDRDRSYKTVFSDICKDYYIADIAEAPNVTHLMSHPYQIDLPDNSVDLVVSGQTFEHIKNPFRSAAELTRVLKKGHYMVLIAPSAGKVHDVIDCWRYYPDSFKAIAEESGLRVIADWIDNGDWEERSARWKDHVFIGQKM